MPRQSVDAQIRETPTEAVGLELKQGPVEGGGGLHVFVVDGKTLAKQVGVRRMKWHTGKFRADGFQRQIDKPRVTEIATYLSRNPILPNALVIAFEKDRIKFDAFPNQREGQPHFGKVVLLGKLKEVDGSLEPVAEDERIGYVIDGQHRLRAIEESTLGEGEFPVVVVGFHGVSSKFQLEQFYALTRQYRSVQCT